MLCCFLIQCKHRVHYKNHLLEYMYAQQLSRLFDLERKGIFKVS